MLSYVEIVNKILSLGIIFIQVVILFLVFNIIFFKMRQNKILNFFKEHTFLIGLLVSISGILFSLFYSIIVGYPPCNLCIIQRIFLYPEFIIFLILIYKENKNVFNFGVLFAFLSLLVSIYHIFVESGKVSSAVCTLGSNSCSVRYVFEFGYITIPVMSLTLSLFILFLLFNFKIKNRL